MSCFLGRSNTHRGGVVGCREAGPFSPYFLHAKHTVPFALPEELFQKYIWCPGAAGLSRENGCRGRAKSKSFIMQRIIFSLECAP